MQELAIAVDEAAGQPATVRVGTITSANPIQIDLEGMFLDPAAVGCVSSYLPRAGDTVVLVGQAVDGADTSASSWMIVGACVNSGSGAFSHNGIQVMAAAQAENAGVFQVLTGVMFPFTKRRAGSLIHGRMAGSSFASAAANGGEFGARITNSAGVVVVNKVLASHFYNPALTHLGWTGFDDIPGMPADTYTVEGIFRRYTGAAAIQTDNNDRISLYFDEV